MKKRILALLAAVFVSITMITPVTAEESVKHTEMEDTYKTDFLTKLGILPDTFDPNKALTRAEFTALVIDALGGAEKFGIDTNTYFLDVIGAHPHFAAINGAAALGIVRGNENGLFYPDKEITYHEAISIALGAMGYNIKAVVRGEYPYGQLKTASDIGILDGIDDSVHGGNLANLVFNMMKEPVLSVFTYSEEYVTYYEDEENTILSLYWNIGYGEGVVTETGTTSLTGDSSIDKGNVRIDDNVYSEEDTNASEYFGYNVEFFYSNTDIGIRPILFIHKLNNLNQDIYIKAEDILAVDMLNCVISYDREGKTMKKGFSKTAYAVYNGAVITDYTEEDFMPDYGGIRLLDNNKDGKYEFVFIDDIHYFVVDSANQSTMKIYGKYTGEVLDLSENTDVVFRITKNDEEISIADIKEYNILSVKADRNHKKINIDVSDKSVSGQVNLMDSEGNVVIQEQTYEIYNNIEKAPKLGDAGVFYISAEGILVAAKDGHLRSIAVVSDFKQRSGFDPECLLKVITVNGESVLKLAEKVNLNGVTMEDDAVFSSLSALYSDVNNSHVIDYELNSNNEIKKITTPQNNMDGSIPYDESNLTVDAVSTKDMRFFKNMLGGQYIVKNSVVVTTPKPGADGVMDPDYISVGSTGLLTEGNSYSNFRLYSIDEYQGVSVIELFNQIDKSSVRDFSYDSSAFIIDQISKGFDKNGDSAIIIDGYQNGTYVTVYADDEWEVDPEYPNTVSTPLSTPDDLKIGDVLQIKKDSTGKIAAYRLLYNIVDGFDEKIFISTAGGYANSGYPHIESAMATVERYSNDTLVARIGDVVSAYLMSNPKVYQYEDGELDEAELSDIEAAAFTGEGSKVLIHANQKNVEEIIIFK